MPLDDDRLARDASGEALDPNFRRRARRVIANQFAFGQALALLAVAALARFLLD